MRYDERVHAINNIRDVDNKPVSTSMICCIFSLFFRSTVQTTNNEKQQPQN